MSQILSSTKPLTGRRKAAAAALIALLAAGVWWATYDAWFIGLGYPDAHDYAQMGRQLSRGEAMTSQQTFPYVLGWLHAEELPTQPPWPNLHRFPLPVLTNALVFRLIGPDDLAAVLPCALFFIGTATLVFLLGNRVYGPLAGAVAAALASLSSTQRHFALSGLTESGAAFFLCAIALSLLALNDRPHRRRRLLLFGGLIGLAFLHRYNLALVGAVAGSLVWFGPERQGYRAAMWIACGAFLVALPWFLANLFEYGSLLVYLNGDRNLLDGVVPDDVFMHIEQHEPLIWLLQNPAIPLQKVLSLTSLEDWRSMFGPEFSWLGPLFVISLIAQRTRERATLYLYVTAAFALTLLAYGATASVARFYQPFAPLLLVMVCGATAITLLGHQRRLRIIAPVLAVSVTLYYTVPIVGTITRRANAVPRLADLCAEIDRLAPPDAVIASPVSYKLAWGCDRPSVRFLHSWDELDEIHRRFVPIAGVFFESHQARLYGNARRENIWTRAFANRHELPQDAQLWLRAREAPLPSTSK